MKTSPLASLLTTGALALLAGCDPTPHQGTCGAAGAVPFATKYIPAGDAAPVGSPCASLGQPLLLTGFDAPGATLPSLHIAVQGLPPDSADGGAQPGASGGFSHRDFDPDDHTCTVPVLSPITRGTLRYTFSDVELYASTAGHSGTQLKAALTIEDTGAGACTARYAVVGLWPETRCASDADCREGSGVHPGLFDEVSCNRDIGACMLEGEDFARLPSDD